jgi:hypothetical protein
MLSGTNQPRGFDGDGPAPLLCSCIHCPNWDESMSNPGCAADPFLDPVVPDPHVDSLAQRPVSGRPKQRRWRYGPFRAVLLVAILIVPGLLDPIARTAPVGHPLGAAASAGTVNRLPAQRETHQAAPPDPSGANPPYPLNHTLDAELVPLGGPTNADFDSAGSSVGTPPTNSGFDTAPTDVGTPPTNFNFATGDFTGWSKNGSLTAIQTTSGPESQWAKFSQAGSWIKTGAFTVDAAAQSITFDLGLLGTSGTILVAVSAMTGASYATKEALRTYSCTGCNSWSVKTVGISAYVGQSIKIVFELGGGAIGIDRVRQQTVFAGYSVAGQFTRSTTAGNPWASIVGDTLTSAAYTIDSTAQLGKITLKGNSTLSDQTYVKVLSGGSYATSTTVVSATLDDDWATYSFDLSSWVGQSIKLKVDVIIGTVGVDDVGIQCLELPG